ncbi:hypothetical protein [Leptotrichia trevisanii]|uniref:Uncharacterized protein n=1 Tax=Leptotrichia trevisanii TaxID=109328 RepID=A0A510K511_9FUSO|nr:hypothetical protein [Leptotrichia trevisanii]BBM44913.1 hypothetical protein JMUB3870_1031 [Leptotrichia trevisanii]
MLELIESKEEKWIEIVKDKLIEFLNSTKIDENLKFIWKEKNIEIVGKYFDQSESNYSTEFPEGFFENIEEIGFDGYEYEVVSKIKNIWLKENFIWKNRDGKVFVLISVYHYPDEIKNLNDEVIWTSSELDLKEKELIDNVHKKIKENIINGNKYLNYLEEFKKLEKIKTNNKINEDRKMELSKLLNENKKIGLEYLRYLNFLGISVPETQNSKEKNNILNDKEPIHSIKINSSLDFKFKNENEKNKLEKFEETSLKVPIQMSKKPIEQTYDSIRDWLLPLLRKDNKIIFPKEKFLERIKLFDEAEKLRTFNVIKSAVEHENYCVKFEEGKTIRGYEVIKAFGEMLGIVVEEKVVEKMEEKEEEKKLTPQQLRKKKFLERMKKSEEEF